jgi:ElaB/YqjD/DUF883 family membrane-anchored ribosome-binding protein
MRGLISLDQEMRAIRMFKGPKSGKGSKHEPELKQPERPWQADIDQVQQTMREVLRAIASLSGVELPGLPPGLQDDGAPQPRLDIKTLKDRFRNELEGFSIKTTEELAKRAKEQTHAALDAIQNEVGGRIDQVAAEFRQQLERRLEPEQINTEISKMSEDHMEKLLEPCVEEAAARLETSFRQKVEHLFAEQEQMVQDRLQGALSSVRAQIGTLEQSVQEIRELKADLVKQLSAERPDAAVDKAMKKHESRLDNEVDGALGKATSHIALSFDNFLETHKIELGQVSAAELQEQRKEITFSNTDIGNRVQQALELLDRLGSKNPHPAGKKESLIATP